MGPSDCGQRDLFAVRPLRQLWGGSRRAGHERYERIQQQADTDIVQRRAAEDGNDIAGCNTGLESTDDLGRRKLLAVQILHDQSVIAFCRSLDELRARFFHGIGHIGWNLTSGGRLPKIGLHANQIDHAAELAPLADR